MKLRRVRLLDRTGLWSMLITDGRVQTIEPDSDDVTLNDGEFDARGGLATRTFSDVHMHLDKAYNSEVMPNQSGTLGEAIEIGQKLKAESTEDMAYQKMIRGARQALGYGSTRLRTHVDVDPIAGLSGVKAALRAREALKLWVDLQIVAFPQEGITGVDGVVDLLDESLRLGCGVIGGIPARDSNPAQHIREVFRLAELHGVPVDMHVDESDDPNDLTLLDTVEATRASGMAGRVAAAHCCSLYAQTTDRRADIIEKVAQSGVHIITLPSTNLYLQGRDDALNPRRGLTPVRELLNAGVNVTFGSDNVRDPFNPFGNANMIEGALILAHGAHMGGTGDIADAFDMATRRAAALLESVQDVASFALTVEEGGPADLLVWQEEQIQELIISQARPNLVIVGGKVAVQRSEQVQWTEQLPNSE